MAEKTIDLEEKKSPKEKSYFSINSVPSVYENGNKRDFIKYEELRHKRNLETSHYIVTHVIALLIVSSIIVAIFLDKQLPEWYWGIASAVIGFYFGSSVLHKKD